MLGGWEWPWCAQRRNALLWLWGDMERKMLLLVLTVSVTQSRATWEEPLNKELSWLFLLRLPVGGCLFCVLIDVRKLGLKGGITIPWVWFLNCVGVEKASWAEGMLLTVEMSSCFKLLPWSLCSDGLWPALWLRTKPFSYKLPLLRIFHHSSKIKLKQMLKTDWRSPLPVF